MDASDLQKEKPIPHIDWQQVLPNGGPPCFFVEGPQYCGRAERWRGHGNKAFHDYVSLHDLLTSIRKEAQAAAFKESVQIVKNAHAQYKNQSSLREAILDGIEAAANADQVEQEKQK